MWFMISCLLLLHSIQLALEVQNGVNLKIMF